MCKTILVSPCCSKIPNIDGPHHLNHTGPDTYNGPHQHVYEKATTPMWIYLGIEIDFLSIGLSFHDNLFNTSGQKSDGTFLCLMMSDTNISLSPTFCYFQFLEEKSASSCILQITFYCVDFNKVLLTSCSEHCSGI